MPPRPKPLTEEQVKQIRESTNFAKAADTLGISEKRAKIIKNASTFDEALKLAQPAVPKSKPQSKEDEKVVERIEESAIKPSAPPPAPISFPAPSEGNEPLPVVQPPQTQEAEGKPVTIQLQQGGDGSYRALIPEEVIGKGIPFKVTLSVRTLAYYQIASTINSRLSLGDFIDDCVQDTFEGRGLSLGLIKRGG